jgi:O-antigen ligase/polysaccharide polymerase Wzy-like membrane protein
MSALDFNAPGSAGLSARILAVLVGLLGLLIFIVVAANKGSLLVLAAIVAGVGVLLLIGRPLLLLTLLAVFAVLIETPETAAFLSGAGRIYDPVISGLTPVELLWGLLLVATLVDVTRRRELRLPAPLTVPLLLLVGAICVGVVTGHYGHSTPKSLFGSVRALSFLVLLPLVVVNLVRTREQLRSAAIVGAALVTVKSLAGLGAVAAGSGFVVDGATITYYEPTANWITLIFLLVVLAALLARVRLPGWVLGTLPLALASLVLSFRRSFWIGAVVGLVLVVLLGLGQLGRRVVLPVAVVLVVGIYLALGANVVTEAQGPIAKRIQSLSPSLLSTNPEDRYRIDERKNVVDAIAAHPLEGLGLDVPWVATHPLSIEHTNGRQYVHFAALWFWLRLGILGVIAYFWILGGAIFASMRLWRRDADPLVRAGGLGVAGAFVALIVAETTASFTGVDVRFTIVLGVVLGLVAAARATATPSSAD